MNSTLQWTLFGLLTLVLMVWWGSVIYMCLRAAGNPKNLRPPKYTAWDIYAIIYQRLYDEGARVLMFDVDRTLCKLGFWGRTEKRLPNHVVALLTGLHENFGFNIILASKSNEHVHDMVSVQFKDKSWITPMVTSKSSPDFAKKLLNRIDDMGWKFDVEYDRIALIGDKLTDMGHDDARYNHMMVPVLTNPQGGYDIIGEYLIMRRTRENELLRIMNVKRAQAPGDFAWVS